MPRIAAALVAVVARVGRRPWRETAHAIAQCRSAVPWHAAIITVAALAVLGGPTALLMNHYHVFGTDTTGNDVLYQALKSIRTAFVIGTLATVATLPVAVVFGIMAGYFRGWVDELIQYLYTVMSSIPNILLIAACVLMVQVFLDKHPEMFETGLERADLKLFLLCAVLGLTNWPGLCRLLRGETLKLRELEYVQAATAFGVGVDPSMNSFGGMINLARSEMSRDPMVWWSFAAAFGFMVTMVLAANLFADGVRDAFDPRARTLRPRMRRVAGT